jgi:glycosyltransferase involved in cell wall biosynthesis
MSTIFIQIASYRDPELPATLRDCLAKATHPENLRFGICWQRDETENLDEFLADRRFRIIAVHYKDSQGACWARNALQSLYAGETYTLQLDSHHRFISGWDQALMEMLRLVDSEKPILTTYAPSYDSADDSRRDFVPPKIGFDRFLPEGMMSMSPWLMMDYQALDRPVRARFYSAHFAFTLGCFCEEIKHDPNIYFCGEEISIAVRSFTCGYDLYHPHRVVLWHEYSGSRRRKHWDDHVEGKVEKPWHWRDAASKERVRALLGLEPAGTDFGEFGLGNVRSLADYERYAGINFKLRLVQGYARENRQPPNPEVYGEEEWLARSEEDFETTICLDKNLISAADDMDFWYVGVHDAAGNELYREDLVPERIYALLTQEQPSFTFWYRAPSRAHTWTVWPHSRSREWLESITGPATR